MYYIKIRLGAVRCDVLLFPYHQFWLLMAVCVCILCLIASHSLPLFHVYLFATIDFAG